MTHESRNRWTGRRFRLVSGAPAWRTIRSPHSIAPRSHADAAWSEFQWNNPHTWIQIVVVDDKGRQTEWGARVRQPEHDGAHGMEAHHAEGGRQGRAVVNPLKDGRPNGSLVKITLPDGSVLGPGDAPPPRPLGSAKS